MNLGVLGVLGPETGVPPVRRGISPRRKAIVRSAEGYVRGCAVLALPVLGGCVRPGPALPVSALLGLRPGSGPFQLCPVRLWLWTARPWTVRPMRVGQVIFRSGVRKSSSS